MHQITIMDLIIILFKKKEKILKISEYIVYRFSNKIIFVSNHLVQDKIKIKSIVIPNGVNIEKKADNFLFLKQLNLIKGRYIFSAGRFTEEKNPGIRI